MALSCPGMHSSYSHTLCQQQIYNSWPSTPTLLAAHVLENTVQKAGRRCVLAPETDHVTPAPLYRRYTPEREMDYTQLFSKFIFHSLASRAVTPKWRLALMRPSGFPKSRAFDRRGIIAPIRLIGRDRSGRRGCRTESNERSVCGETFRKTDGEGGGGRRAGGGSVTETIHTGKRCRCRRPGRRLFASDDFC